MFGFSWVRTHLRVVFGEDFRLFWSFGLIFGKKGGNKQNLGKFGGPMSGLVTLCSSVGPCHGVACPSLRRG